MALHPDFPRTPYIYVNYTYEEFSSRLSRLTYSLQESAVVDTTVLIHKFQGNSSHNGSRMIEGPDGYLYMSMGDAYLAMNAQDPSLMAGKVSFGWTGMGRRHRAIHWEPRFQFGAPNPQGLVFSDDGQLYLSEHGASSDDEVNVIEEGANYGWPHVEGFCDQIQEGRMVHKLGREAAAGCLDADDGTMRFGVFQSSFHPRVGAFIALDVFENDNISEFSVWTLQVSRL